jgi:ABC-2 type transport system ATP-binding protein
VIFSSHILSEVQAVCSRVLVINDGHIVADNFAEAVTQTCEKPNKILIQAEGDSETVRNLINEVAGVLEVSEGVGKTDGIYEYVATFDGNFDVRRNLFRLLAQNDCPIVKFDVVEPSLEDAFLELTSTKHSENSETFYNTEGAADDEAPSNSPKEEFDSKEFENDGLLHADSGTESETDVQRSDDK